MLVILKIPIVYLCAVVWWAIKAEPRPLEGAGQVAPAAADTARAGAGVRLVATPLAVAPYRPLPRGGRSVAGRVAAGESPVSAIPDPADAPQHGHPGGRRGPACDCGDLRGGHRRRSTGLCA